MRSLRFGIKTAPEHTTYEEILAVWQEADENPAFEHAWLFDHLAPVQGDLGGPCLECWTLLSALAVQTKRLRLGLMVTGNTYRHPAVLTKIACTLDVISNGRLDFGIGAGWNEYEHTSMGIPLYRPGERIRRLGEACEIYKRLCTQQLTDYAGRYYQLQGARNAPKPVQQPYPPIVIGGSGEQLTLRVVAQHADIWNATGLSAEVFAHKVAVIRDHCMAIGRDPDEIELSIQTRINSNNLDATVESVRSLVDAGATHIVFYLDSPFREGIITRLAEEVIPKIIER